MAAIISIEELNRRISLRSIQHPTEIMIDVAMEEYMAQTEEDASLLEILAGVFSSTKCSICDRSVSEHSDTEVKECLARGVERYGEDDYGEGD